MLSAFISVTSICAVVFSSVSNALSGVAGFSRDARRSVSSDNKSFWESRSPFIASSLLSRNDRKLNNPTFGIVYTTKVRGLTNDLVEDYSICVNCSQDMRLRRNLRLLSKSSHDILLSHSFTICAPDFLTTAHPLSISTVYPFIPL